MSFSEEVRRELCTYINDKDKRFACLYGMLLFSRSLESTRICFQSKSATAADTFGELFARVFRQKLTRRESADKNGRIMYIYDTSDSELIQSVFGKYHLSDDSRSIDCDMISTSSLGALAAGVFLAGGSVNDPQKEYHLEFKSPDEKLANELISLLGDIGVTAGLTVRRNQYIVYIKGSESIEDTLTFIGAQQCALDIMNTKILKDFRNKANRIRNCDNANIEKTVSASIRQVNDIRLIEARTGLDSLPPDLREIAELRLEDVTMSLNDIGESLTVPLSRSGVNHRMRRIAKIADELRRQESENES